MVSIKIFKVLYVITHGLYTLFHLFYEYLGHVSGNVRNFFYEFLSETEKAKYLQDHLQKNGKRPKHLTVVLGGEEFSFKDLAKLIIWCITTQISFISFYDYKGL